ncbi:MAG: hypothetical protein AMJ79_06800 [Phycisphaerae bacterium SM23_30]|nr:MAG: hypothetical protein AMJ79_06800 [Phycisphaerae bacterium SM23_30]
MTKPITKPNKKKWYLYIIIAVVGVTAGIILAKGRLVRGEADMSSLGAYRVARQDLTISVVESGEVKTRYTTDVLCEVEESGITIVYLIDEGMILTEEDVEKGTVLVELDSAELKDEFLEKDMDINEERAEYIGALRDLEIQIEQNNSDIMAAKLDEEFALMDLKRYLGEDLAAGLIEQDELKQDLFQVEVEATVLDADPNALGEALQKLRELRNGIEKGVEDIQRADSKLAGTRKLFENKYVTKMELDADEAAYNQAERSLESRRTALQLFWDYEFIKESKQLLSNCQESKRRTARVEAMAAAKLAQAEARLDNRKNSLQREEEDWQRIKKSLDACVVRAPAPGIVLYGKENFQQRGGDRSNIIELGATVRNHQKLISIPSAHDMVVRVKVNEKWIDMVTPGQAALITLSAYPGELFTGEVYDVAAMPSAFDRRVSGSDVKVYDTMVSIDGVHPEIRDGMNAQVEIIVDKLEGVICVPVQAVASAAGKKVSYVLKADGSRQERTVEVGAYNNNFIEIKDGLEAGELVSLIMTRQAESEGQIEQQRNEMIDRALEGGRGNQPAADAEGARPMRRGRGQRMGPEEGGMPTGQRAGQRTRGEGPGGQIREPPGIRGQEQLPEQGAPQKDKGI